MARIYISSTHSDLKEGRAAAIKALRMLGHDVVTMEEYIPEGLQPLDRSLSNVASCDLYVGIFAWRYGFIPPDDNPDKLSITELEYRKAEELGKHRLVFLLDENAPWPRSMTDEDVGRISKLRYQLKKELIVGLFQNSDELARMVTDAIVNWSSRDYALDNLSYSSLSDAYDRVVNFASRFGEPHITLAMLAALPLGLTPELVHLIRVNFVNRAPMIAEADLLLSPLCREVGGGLYEMYPEVRELLLAELNEDEEISESKIEELAEFLMVYATRNLNSARFPELRNFLVAQQWMALARLRPAETAQSLALALGKRLSAQNPAGSLRLAQLARSMSAQLTGQDNVLVYAAGVESLAFGDVKRASETFGVLGSMSQSPAVKSITLPAPADLAQLWPESAEGLWAQGLWAETQSVPSPLPAYVRLRDKISEGGTPTTQVAWSPDGGLIIGASTEGALRLWDVKTGSLLRSFGGIPREVNDIAWSPDGRFIATASLDNEVSIWTTESGKLMTRLAGYAGDVKSVAWSPDGNMLASATANGIVLLWDVRTGQTLSTLAATSQEANSVAWSSAGAYYLVAGYGNGDVIAWDTNSGNTRRTYRGHKVAVNSVAISPNRAVFASGSNDGAIRIWRIDEPADNFQITLEGHTQPVSKICFSSNGRLLASRSNDDTVRVWRSPDWRCVAIINVSTSFAGANAYFPALAFHPSEPLLATCVDRPDEISILELDEEKLINSSPDTHD